MIFAASLILPYIRLGSFSDSMVIPGSLPGLLYLVRSTWFSESKMSSVDFFQLVDGAKLSFQA